NMGSFAPYTHGNQALEQDLRNGKPFYLSGQTLQEQKQSLDLLLRSAATTPGGRLPRALVFVQWKNRDYGHAFNARWLPGSPRTINVSVQRIHTVQYWDASLGKEAEWDFTKIDYFKAYPTN